MYSIYCKLRDEKQLKDSDVSKATGITKSTFSDWKSGRSKPKQDKLQKIADYFGVSLEYLTTGKEKEWKPTLSEKEHIDIGRDVQATLNALDSNTGLMFDGEILDEETKEYLESALKTAFTNAKIMAKEKYTPNKYRK